MDSVNQSISRLLEAQVSWNARNEVDEEVAPRQPATDADIDGLSKALGHGLPPSYEQLLRTHDGIAGAFGIDGEFLSSRYRGEYDDQWADCTELAGCPPQSEMLFFAMDDDGSAAEGEHTERLESESRVAPRQKPRLAAQVEAFGYLLRRRVVTKTGGAGLLEQSVE